MSTSRNHVAVAVALVLLPAVVATFTLPPGAVELLCIAIIPALVGLLHGVRTAVVSVCGTAALVTACTAASPSPWAAAVVMIVLGLVSGRNARRGLQTLTASAAAWPTVLLVVPPYLLDAPTGSEQWFAEAVLAGLLVVLGGAWTLTAMTVLVPHLPHPAATVPVARSVATAYGAGLAVLLGTAAAIVVGQTPGTTAGWVLLTILVTARPDSALTLHRVVGRAVGTVLGGVVASGIGALVTVPVVVSFLGLVGIAAAVVLQLRRADYAIYSFALTCALVLVDSSGHDFLRTGEQRVVSTIIGAGISTGLALVLPLVSSVIGRWRSGHPIA